MFWYQPQSYGLSIFEMRAISSIYYQPQSRSSSPPNPPIGGADTAKRAPNCLEGPKVASIQKQNFALRIVLNGIFCAQILYISVLKFFAIVSFQIAS